MARRAGFKPRQGKGDKGEGERQKMRCLRSLTGSMNVNWSRLQEIMGDKGAWHATVHGLAKLNTT